MFRLNLITTAGMLTAVGAAIAAYANGDYVNAVGIVAAALSSTAVRRTIQPAPVSMGSTSEQSSGDSARARSAQIV